VVSKIVILRKVGAPVFDRGPWGGHGTHLWCDSVDVCGVYGRVSASLPLEGENEKDDDDEQRRERRAEGARVGQTLHLGSTMQSEVRPVNFRKGENP
jgi:hypothetical protein